MLKPCQEERELLRPISIPVPIQDEAYRRESTRFF